MPDSLARRIERLRKLAQPSIVRPGDRIIDCTNAKEQLLAKLEENNPGLAERASETVLSAADKEMLQGLRTILQARIREDEEKYHVKLVSYSTDRK